MKVTTHKALGSVRGREFGLIVLILVAAFSISAAAQDTAFQLDPAQTTVKFTLGDVLHTVHGTFKLKRGGAHVGRMGGL